MIHPDCIQATVNSFMIWPCMSVDGIGRLHIMEGALNARKYIDTILEPKFLPSIRDLFTNDASFTFQQHSSLCNIVNSVENKLRPGGPSKLNSRAKRMIVRSATNKPMPSAQNIVNELLSSCNFLVSAQTAQRWSESQNSQKETLS
ncbi:transposable element Tcb1 transposase [Trichonephila clavipes]|uniref:Transposable element Tcb1 transposase n=1 Tax=Trichonephila clavipes TaxID=2585209 RepID=A0A8X6S9S2_TRICX|nr:transposable element Tcb1 transposase [Trichonephila clavipes]